MPLVRKPGNNPPVAGVDPSGILKGLDSSDPEERWAAARAAATVAGSSVALADALRKEKNPRVREALFTGLARGGTSESVDELVSFLRSDDANLRRGALDALRMVSGATSELLPRLLEDPDADVRTISCELARSLHGEEATTLLCKLLAGEQDINVCAAAIDVLAEVGTATALPTLAECQRRFVGTQFLTFAIKITTDRISSPTKRTRG